MNNLESIFIASLFNTILDSIVNEDEYKDKEKEEVVEKLNKKIVEKNTTTLNNFTDTQAYIDIVNAIATDAQESVRALEKKVSDIYFAIEDIHNRLKKLEAKN